MSTKLALLYHSQKNYVGSVKIIDEILNRLGKQDQLKLLRIKAKGLAYLGELPKAIISYDTLAKIDNKNIIEYQYEKGALLFKNRQIKEGVAIMYEIIANPNSKTQTTTIQSDWGVDKVPYYLSALNYIGYIYIESGKLEDSQKIYSQIQATKIPFKLAQGNMKLLEKRKAQLAKKTTK